MRIRSLLTLMIALRATHDGQRAACQADSGGPAAIG